MVVELTTKINYRIKIIRALPFTEITRTCQFTELWAPMNNIVLKRNEGVLKKRNPSNVDKL